MSPIKGLLNCTGRCLKQWFGGYFPGSSGDFCLQQWREDIHRSSGVIYYGQGGEKVFSVVQWNSSEGKGGGAKNTEKSAGEIYFQNTLKHMKLT